MCWILLFDPGLIRVIVFGTLLFVMVSVFLVGFIIYFQQRKFQHEREIQELHDTYLNTRLEIQEQTLQTISKELHDSVNADLLNIHLNLLTVKEEMGKSAGADATVPLPKIEETDQEVLAVIQELRQISKRLSSDYFDNFGLIEAIRQEVAFINKTKRLKAELKTEGDLIELDKMKSLVLFRILQESLNNVKKHSGAKKVDIALRYETSGLTMLIEDNGKGFDPDQLYNSDAESGSGLRNMKNRAQQIGATFQMDSAEGKGTLIRIQYPF